MSDERKRVDLPPNFGVGPQPDVEGMCTVLGLREKVAELEAGLAAERQRREQAEKEAVAWEQNARSFVQPAIQAATRLKEAEAENAKLRERVADVEDALSQALVDCRNQGAFTGKPYHQIADEIEAAMLSLSPAPAMGKYDVRVDAPGVHVAGAGEPPPCACWHSVAEHPKAAYGGTLCRFVSQQGFHCMCGKYEPIEERRRGERRRKQERRRLGAQFGTPAIHGRRVGATRRQAQSDRRGKP